MSTDKYLSDYLTIIGNNPKDGLRKSAFLYLADNLNVQTGCDFSYFHHSITHGQVELLPDVVLTTKQAEALDRFVLQSSEILDTLCTIVRFANVGVGPERLQEMVLELKGHYGEAVAQSVVLADEIFGLKMPIKSTATNKISRNIDLFPGVLAGKI